MTISSHRIVQSFEAPIMSVSMAVGSILVEQHLDFRQAAAIRQQTAQRRAVRIDREQAVAREASARELDAQCRDALMRRAIARRGRTTA